jgi:hypothetical protein
MIRDIAIARERANAYSIFKWRHLVQRERGNIDKMGRRFYVKLHEIDQISTARNIHSLVLSGNDGKGRNFISRSCIFKRLHLFLSFLWLAERSTSRTSHVFLIGLSDFLNSGNDVGVRPTTAKVATHSFSHIVIGWAARLMKEAERRHNLSRRTISTLQTIVRNKSGLEWMKLIILCQTLNRGNSFSLIHKRKGQTRKNAATIDENGTGSTLTMITPFFGTRQSKILTQSIEQTDTWIGLEDILFPVDSEMQLDKFWPIRLRRN